MTSQVQTSDRRATAAAQGEIGREASGREKPWVVPPVDVFENESGITLLADLPGVARENLGVRIDGDTLLIEATATLVGPSEMELVHGEAQVPSYRRQFTLSRELDSGRIDASLKDGVLRLTIPKLEEAKPRQVTVRVE